MRRDHFTSKIEVLDIIDGESDEEGVKHLLEHQNRSIVMKIDLR